MNQYLAKQFSGTLVQSQIDATQAEYAKADSMLSYWHDLTIDTADENDLVSIGYLVGYPWPTAPTGTLDANAFKFGASGSYPTVSTIGLSTIGSLVGGILTSSLPSVNNKVPITVYRQLLKAIAFAKWNGLSYETIDAIAASFGTLNYSYTSFAANKFTFGTSASYPTFNTTTSLGYGRLQSTNAGYFPDSDIYITYLTPITSANIWVCQETFNAITTSPRVFVSNGV